MIVGAIGYGGVVESIIVHATALFATCVYLQKTPVYIYKIDLYTCTDEMEWVWVPLGMTVWSV